MTGAELLTYIKETFKRTDKDTELYRAITDTLVDIRLRHPFEKAKKTSASLTITALGDYTIALPSDFGHILGKVKLLDDDNSWPLRKVTKEEYDAIIPNPAYEYSSGNIGRPTIFCIFDEKIWLGAQIPDSASYTYYMDYSDQAETEVAAGTADVPFSEYRELLKYGALYRAYADLELDDQASKYKTLYEDKLADLIKNDDRNVAAPDLISYQGN